MQESNNFSGVGELSMSYADLEVSLKWAIGDPSITWKRVPRDFNKAVQKHSGSWRCQAEC